MTGLTEMEYSLYLNEWFDIVYNELDELEEYVDENNILMFKTTLRGIKDMLEDLDDKVSKHIVLGDDKK